VTVSNADAKNGMTNEIMVDLTEVMLQLQLKRV
jgi:hypothetical protein